jgi:hypothetical protein
MYATHMHMAHMHTIKVQEVYYRLISNYRSAFQEQIEYVINLPTNIRQSLRDYTCGWYEEINSAMRSITTPNPEVVKRINHLNEALQGVPPLQHSVTLYRGQKGDLKSVFDTTSFTSTSHDIDAVIDFVGTNSCLYVFEVQPGSQILPLFTESCHPSEFEVLLKPAGILANTYNITTNVEFRRFEARTLYTYHLTYLPPLSHVIRHSSELTPPSSPSPSPCPSVSCPVPRPKLVYPVDEFITQMRNLAGMDEDFPMYDLHNSKDLAECYEMVKKSILANIAAEVPTCWAVKAIINFL